MAKKRTLNEYRQTKEYKLDRLEKAHKLNDAAKAKLHEFKDVEFDDLETPEEIENIQKELEYKEWANEANNSKEMRENRKFKNPVELAKEQIIKELKDQYYDIIFQAVADKMNENYMFKENNYFTEAGMDEFEDAWFEWYHNHHGDILMAVLKDMGQ